MLVRCVGDLNESFHPPRVLRQGGVMEDCFSALGLPIMPTHPARPSSPEEDALVRHHPPTLYVHVSLLERQPASVSPDLLMSPLVCVCPAGRVSRLDLRDAPGPSLAGECDSSVAAPHECAAVGPLPGPRHVPIAALYPPHADTHHRYQGPDTRWATACEGGNSISRRLTARPYYLAHQMTGA